MSPTPMRHPETGLRDYRPDLHEPPRWVGYVLLLAFFLVAFSLGFATSAFSAPVGGQDVPTAHEPYRSEVHAELPCLELHVTPAIMLPLTRTTIHLQARVRRHAHHRQLSLAWDGGLAGGGASSRQLRGEDEPYLHVRELREMPGAPWTFVGAVFDQAGTLTGRRTASIRMPLP